MIDFEKVKAVANTNENYIMKLLPAGKRLGNEIRCGTIYGDKGDSFSYNIKTGVWSDFATGQSGASIIDLVACRENCKLIDAAEIISRDFGGIDNYSVEIKAKDDDVNVKITALPCPTGVLPVSIKRGDIRFEFSHVWAYHTEDGQVIACDARVDKKDGSKEVIPFLFNGRIWTAKALKNNRYLYNLDRISQNKDRSILIVEGCKTADAASSYFPNYAVTTWQGGCNAVKKTNWEPLYGRKVIIFPDSDECGRKAAEEIAELLSGKASIVKIVDTSSMEEVKKGWDLADALESNMPQAEVVGFVRSHIAEYAVNPKEMIANPEVIIRKHIDSVQYDDTYFKVLGVQGDTHFFYKRATSQIIEFKPNHYDAKHLVTLAPLQYWEVNYPAKGGVDWLSATDYLCRLQEKIGFFDNTKIRGRGAWFDDGRTVLHLGNVIYTNGKVIDVDDFDSEYFYEKAPSLALWIQTPLPVEETKKFVDLCCMPRWAKDSYGEILAGWIFSALVCGAMPFRSHLYLVGAAGSGKSWLLENIVKPLMGVMALNISSKSTEAGIRDALGGDLRPIIFDEAEAEEKQDKIRMQAIFDLARNASSENSDAIVKFGAKYMCRSAFLFASINNSMSKIADLSRTAFIRLQNPPSRADAESKHNDLVNFQEMEAVQSRLLTPEYCNSFLSRALMMVPILRRSHQIIADVAAKTFGNRRLGDQMAMIIAGLHALRSNDIITPYMAGKYIEDLAMANEKEDVLEGKTQEERCLDHILFEEINLNFNTYRGNFPLASLVSYIHGDIMLENVPLGDVVRYLAERGIRVKDGYLYLGRNVACLPNKIFSNTEWEYSWSDALRRLGGVKYARTNLRFSSTLVTTAVLIPLSLITRNYDPLAPDNVNEDV